MRSLRCRFLRPGAVVMLLAVAGCSSGGTADARPEPRPSGEETRYCRALLAALPGEVNGAKRRDGGRGSEFSAAWGRPSVVLRCGVGRPLVVTEGHKSYDPYAPTMEIDGVEWLLEPQRDGSVRCTTSKRRAWVEVTVPKEYMGKAGGISLLTDLADAVKKTVPFGYI
ncbi:DUF3515 domain-containing protein [Streptomyces triculaminicus]|uniref:DUF3515 domain-containing protein n=1 Tax=Streptomyces triculaminicus TaxID=2816232 RepID=A0A939FGU2_9ACTN|nr:DUF3515 domain-containing protein [Streptomyces triculaminicus]MBO0651635.1 DUF3515 domain-containing protein [Streptomyces triculaminicus]